MIDRGLLVNTTNQAHNIRGAKNAATPQATSPSDGTKAASLEEIGDGRDDDSRSDGNARLDASSGALDNDIGRVGLGEGDRLQVHVSLERHHGQGRKERLQQIEMNATQGVPKR